MMLTTMFKEMVLGGHLLALGTSSMAASSAILLNQMPTSNLLLIAYLFSYGAYTVNRSAEMGLDAISNPRRTQYLQGRRRYLPLIATACFAVGYVLAALVDMIFLLALIIPLLLSLLYSVGSKKLVPLVGVGTLKKKLLVKNITISSGWLLVPLLVGLYYQQFTPMLLLFGTFVFLRLMVNTIFFDLRDSEGDTASEIRTIPTVYGRERSFTIMVLVDILSAVYIISLVGFEIFPVYAASAVVFPIYSAVYLWLAKRTNVNVNLLCDVVADGEYILWGPVIYLGRTIF